MSKLHFTLALACLLAAPAVAQTTGAPAEGSRAAAMAQLKAEFVASDLNHDGVLTRAEVSNRMARMKVATADHGLRQQQVKMLTDLFFARSDANKDGRITLPESQRTMGAVFDRYDRDRDGVLSPDERRAALSRVSRMPVPGRQAQADEGR